MMKFVICLVIVFVGSLKSFSCNSLIVISAISPANDTVCAQMPVQYGSIATDNGGTGDTYQWQVNGTDVVNANSSTFTYTPAPTDVVTCILNNSCGTITSNNLYPVIKPVLHQIPAQIFCGNYTTTPVKLNGASWINNNTSIGLAASGTGDIPSFIAINNDTVPVTAIITATLTCSTTNTAVFPIIINPVRIVRPVTSQAVCAGDTTTPIYFNGPVANTVFNWTSSNTNIGIAPSGTDSIPSFTGINAGNKPVIDTITVTPYTNGYAYMTDAINGNAYSVSRATNNLVSIINLMNGFFNFAIGITVSSDGKWVYVANNGYNTVSVIDGMADTLCGTINVGSNPYGIVISPDGKKVYVVNNGDATVSVISTATNTIISNIFLPVGCGPQGIALSPDGSRLYVTGQTDTGKVYFINTGNNLLFDSVTVGSNPIGIIVSPDGEKVYTANYLSLNISTITVSTKNVTTSAPYTGTVPGQPESNGLALSPDGLTLYVSSFWDGTVVYYNTSTNPPALSGTINLPGGGGEAPVGLSMSSDGQYLYVSNCGNGYYPSNYSSLDIINTATKTVISSNVIVNPSGEEVSYSLGNFVSGIACTGTPYVFTITVNPVGGKPSVGLAVTSGSKNTCTGSPVTFTATPDNVGTTPTYNFLVNDSSVQDGTSLVFTSTSFNNNDTVICLMTGNSCGIISTTSSNSIVVAVSPPVIQNILTNADSICQGGNALLSLMANVGTIQWQSSQDNSNYTDIIGAADSLYIASPAQTTYYRAYGYNSSCSDTSVSVKLVVKAAPELPSLTSTDTIICSGDSAQVCIMNNFAAYTWNTSDTTSCTFATQAGNYWVTVTGWDGCKAVSSHKAISTYSVSSVSIIVQGDTLSSFGAVSYQWYLNGHPIQGATASLYVASASGSYTLQVTDVDGCTNISSPVVISGVNDLLESGLSLYPNPSVGSWQLVVSNELVGSKLEVYNNEGQIILQSQIRNPKSEIVIDVPSGLYWLRISSDNSTIVRKLLKI